MNRATFDKIMVRIAGGASRWGAALREGVTYTDVCNWISEAPSRAHLRGAMMELQADAANAHARALADRLADDLSAKRLRSTRLAGEMRQVVERLLH